MIKKLIIVDDDSPFRERLGRSMEKKGFIVETLSNYNDCLKRFLEEYFDYAIIDMRLEDGSGLELIKKLRETTGSGIVDCKKALSENDNDIEASIKWLREKGILKAQKKQDRETNVKADMT